MEQRPTPATGSSGGPLSGGAYPGWQIALSFFLGWLMVTVGALGTLYAPVSFLQTRAFLRHAVHAAAPIVEFKSYPPDRHQSHETYRPIVEVTANGASARVLVGEAAYPNPLKIGDRLNVLYAPGDPADAVLDDVEGAWGVTIAIAIFFPIVLLIGIGIVVWMRHFVRHTPAHLMWLDRWSAPLRLLSRVLTG